MNLIFKTLSVSLVGLLVGCGSLDIDTSEYLPDKKIDYKKTTSSAGNLEIPPDLSSVADVSRGRGGIVNSYSDYIAKKDGGSENGTFSGRVLPKLGSVRVVRDGDDRWLIMESDVDDVWSNVVDFWQESGILLLEQDPTIGIMRTDWLENRANIKNDFITDFVRGTFDGLYEASTRDQYRVRLERGVAPGTTELYLTHFGMEEEFQKGSSGDDEQGLWKITGRDRGLEAEMLRRLMVHVGIENNRASSALAAEKNRAKKKVRSSLVKGLTGVQLIVADRSSRAWRLVGLSLDRVGFPVEDRDRSKGIYYVRYSDPSADDVDSDKGWFSKLSLWNEDEKVDLVNRYQVVVKAEENRSIVIINNESGVRDNSSTALRILTLLKEQIR